MQLIGVKEQKGGNGNTETEKGLGPGSTSGTLRLEYQMQVIYR